jgi:uncharacterized peroxidase-related enzyme
MTWIKTIPVAQADNTMLEVYRRIRSHYPAEYGSEVPALIRADGSTDSIVASHSLLPEVMEPIFVALGKLLSPDLPLARRQHEMIATLVSSLNRCFYWIESHAEFLRLVTLDASLAEAIRTDYTQANLNEQDRAMLDYAARLTRNAPQITPADIERLHAVGFTDEAVLQINLIASWFNYINRVADGLGVGR